MIKSVHLRLILLRSYEFEFAFKGTLVLPVSIPNCSTSSTSFPLLVYLHSVIVDIYAMHIFLYFNCIDMKGLAWGHGCSPSAPVFVFVF